MPNSFYGKTGLEFSGNMETGLERLRTTVHRAAVQAVLEVAEDIRSRAYDLANVSPRVIGHAEDGRHMRDCIEIGLQENDTSITARIGIDMGNVPYAADQEFGPRGKPFLRPAIDEARQEAHDKLQAVLGGKVEGVHTSVRFRSIA